MKIYVIIAKNRETGRDVEFFVRGSGLNDAVDKFYKENLNFDVQCAYPMIKEEK